MLRSLISRTASFVGTACSRLLVPQPACQNAIVPKGGLLNQIRTALTWPTKEEFAEFKFLINLHKRGPKLKRERRHPTDGRPQMKGIVLRTLIKKPKKPNSANRKCVLVKLSNGREAVAYIPGIGHNLQEHSQVLVHFRRVQDVPGLRLKVIRGVLDCAPVMKQTT